MRSCLLVSRLVYPLVSANRIFRSRPRPLPLPLPGGWFRPVLLESWSLLVAPECVSHVFGFLQIYDFKSTATDVAAFEATWKKQNDGEIFTLCLLFPISRSQTLHTCSKEKAKMRICRNWKNRTCPGFPLKRRRSGPKTGFDGLRSFSRHVHDALGSSF